MLAPIGLGINCILAACTFSAHSDVWTATSTSFCFLCMLRIPAAMPPLLYWLSYTRRCPDFQLRCRASNTTLREYDHAVKRGQKRSSEACKRDSAKAWEEVHEKWHALQHLLHKRTSLDAARKGKGKASAGMLSSAPLQSCQSLLCAAEYPCLF